MLTTVELTLDCADAPALAEFWKLAAGYVHHPPPYATMQEWQAHQARLQTSPKGVWWALRSFAPLLHGPPTGGPWSFGPRDALCALSDAAGRRLRRRGMALGRRRNRSHRVPPALRRGVAWRTRPGRWRHSWLTASRRSTAGTTAGGPPCPAPRFGCSPVKDPLRPIASPGA